ncbi:MAG: GNAT family N-acetyltransferase [Parvularculaceae bacterium]
MARAEILIATRDDDVAAVKLLFQEYKTALGEDLCFQGFDEEMATFPSKYPLLLLGDVEDEAAGAVGLFDLGGGVCEMKRLYVRPDFQGEGLGRALAVRLIDEARSRGFKEMKLDTLVRLKPAIALYQSLGFRFTSAYYDNPLQNVVYMAKDL